MAWQDAEVEVGGPHRWEQKTRRRREQRMVLDTRRGVFDHRPDTLAHSIGLWICNAREIEDRGQKIKVVIEGLGLARLQK